MCLRSVAITVPWSRLGAKLSQRSWNPLRMCQGLRPWRGFISPCCLTRRVWQRTVERGFEVGSSAEIEYVKQGRLGRFRERFWPMKMCAYVRFRPCVPSWTLVHYAETPNLHAARGLESWSAPASRKCFSQSKVAPKSILPQLRAETACAGCAARTLLVLLHDTSKTSGMLAFQKQPHRQLALCYLVPND